MGYCTFVFFRPSDGRYRRIITAGEEPIARRAVDDINAPLPGMIETYKKKMRPR
jgi:hypothetical protein